MHPQLDLVADEYRSAQARLHELVRAVPEERWGRRADPARWSVAECVAHLNLTSMAYLPLLQHAVSRARMLERRPPGRYHRDPIGWLLWATMGPPVRVRLTSPFNARVRYNLYSCFTILPRHQHRHLWQAERVWA